MKAKRKIIQISATSIINEDGDSVQVLAALCNDGTAWYLGYDGEWNQENPIPQD